MAQTGFTPISLYYTATASAAPTAGNLVAGELAINTNDGKLFYKDSSGVVQTIASKATGTVAGATTQVIYNNAGAYAGSANLTFDGTTLTSTFSGPHNGTVGATTPNTGAFTNLSYTGTLTGGTGVVNLGSGQFYKDASGNVGIGTTSPSGKLHVNGQTYIQGSVSGGLASSTLIGNASGQAQFWGLGADTSTTGSITFIVARSNLTNSNQALTIDSSGNLTIGGTSALGKVGVYWNSSSQQGLVFKTSSSTFNGYPVIFYNNVDVASGIITQAQNSVTYGTSSDYRLKENIEPMVGALDKVSALKPVTYTWKSDGSDGQGFIAHELQEVCPDAVSGNKDAVNEDGSIKPQSVDTSFLVATLTAAIQELNAKVEAQAAEIAALKAK